MKDDSRIAATSRIDDPHDYFPYIDVPSISEDLVVGADNGAIYLFGEADRRRFYHLAETSRLPVARLGSKLAIQKSVIRAFFWEQQSRSFANDNVEALIRLRLLLLKFLELFRPMEGQRGSNRALDYVQLAYTAVELSKIIRVLTDRAKR
jgi:hypothetical protein